MFSSFDVGFFARGGKVENTWEIGDSSAQHKCIITLDGVLDVPVSVADTQLQGKALEVSSCKVLLQSADTREPAWLMMQHAIPLGPLCPGCVWFSRQETYHPPQAYVYAYMPPDFFECIRDVVRSAGLIHLTFRPASMMVGPGDPEDAALRLSPDEAVTFYGLTISKMEVVSGSAPLGVDMARSRRDEARTWLDSLCVNDWKTDIDILWRIGSDVERICHEMREGLCAADGYEAKLQTFLRIRSIIMLTRSGFHEPVHLDGAKESIFSLSPVDFRAIIANHEVDSRKEFIGRYDQIWKFTTPGSLALVCKGKGKRVEDEWMPAAYDLAELARYYDELASGKVFSPTLERILIHASLFQVAIDWQVTSSGDGPEIARHFEVLNELLSDASFSEKEARRWICRLVDKGLEIAPWIFNILDLRKSRTCQRNFEIGVN